MLGLSLRLGPMPGAQSPAPVAVSFTTAPTGTTYTRSGAKSEFIGGAVYSFAANAPGRVDGHGYFSRAAVTNYLLQNRSLTSPWTPRGGITVTTDGQTRADGTGAAARVNNLNYLGSNDLYQEVSGLPSGQRFEPSFMIKKITETGALGVTNPANSANGDWHVALDLLGSGWEYITRSHPAVTINAEFTAVGTGGGLHFYNVNPGVDQVSAYFDFMSVIPGTVPGPVAATAGSPAEVGADVMSVAAINGAYSAQFTFDDDSIQTIAATVAGGAYTLPVHPTALNRPLIKSLALTPA